VPTSHGVDSTPELCVSGRSTSYRVTRGVLRSACFHAPAGLDRPDRPPALSNRVHSLLSRLLFGVTSPFLLFAPFGAKRPARVSPLFAASPAASTCTEALALPLRSAPRLSQPLDGFLRLRCCGLIASRCHVQGSPFRGFSRSAAAPARRRPFPPCRCRPITHRQAGCHGQTPRLRGFAPRIVAFSRVGGWPSLEWLPSSVSASFRLRLTLVAPVPRVLRS
jgi:hypothetical protein